MFAASARVKVTPAARAHPNDVAGVNSPTAMYMLRLDRILLGKLRAD